MSHPLCQQCGERPAVIFITQTIDDHSTKGRFCEKCAREKAMGEGWLTELLEQWGDESLLSGDQRDALEEVSIDEIMLELFETEFSQSDPHSAGYEENDDGVFLLGDDLDDEAEDFESDAFENDGFESDPLQPHILEPAPQFAAALRCPNCNTTWDRIKQDGRAGCALCYSAFRDQLLDVMSRVQRGETHVGKTPRQAQKRRRRAEHLRARREHQLEMLNNRLREAVAAEKYEVAAKLRDKIREVNETPTEE